MKPKHIILTLLCLCLLLAAPAAADSTDNQTTTISEKPAIKIQHYDHSAAIREILSSADNPTKKLSRMTEAIGYTDQLHAWMHSEVDLETGERIYQKGLVASILGFFGIGNEEPFASEEEAEAAQAEYYANFILNYRPSGGFGDPIA